MANDIAIFLDLDNLVIGARDANLNFDINLIIDEIKQRTGGRVVYRRAYSGNLRQDQKLMKEMAGAGFTMQSAVSLNNFGKNLIDMYLVVDTMDTLVDGPGYDTYVIVTGDRDFLPLIHTLRKRGKYVIGIGLKHTTSENLIGLCDEYIYYENMMPVPPLTDDEVESLLVKAVNVLLADDDRVRASIVKERMIELSGGQFGRLQYSDTSFSKFLGRHADIITLEKDGTTTYVHRISDSSIPAELFRRYRSALKKQKLRVVPPRVRLGLLKGMIDILQPGSQMEWRQLIDRLAERQSTEDPDAISRNIINATIVLARRAGVVRTLKGKTLSTAPVLPAFEGPKAFQESVIRCDMVYLEAIRALPEPFDVTEAALAIYDQPSYASYINQLVTRLDAAHGESGA